MATAIEIYQGALDATRAAIMANDFDAYRAHYTFPHFFDTFGEQQRIESETGLRTLFDALLRKMNDNGITDIERICTTAAFKDADTLHAAHETVMPGPNGRSTPYPNLGEMRLVDGVWRFSRMQSAADGTHLLSHAIREALDRQFGDAKRILQEVINAHTGALLRGDIDALSEICAFPFTLSTREGQIVFDRPDDTFRSAARAFTDAMQAAGVDRFVRVALEGHFLAPDRIEGRFQNYFLRRNVDIFASYPGQAVLLRKAEGFRVSEIVANKASETWTLVDAHMPKLDPRRSAPYGRKR